ncbi:MAG: hypothetical protein BWY52_03047 [Chloroflexi bacterium ADurb.Bin325]|nr:MAG: hypothetical protein BWY52_03047 [Chloroflexi bacterium ADurb.Bin325]
MTRPQAIELHIEELALHGFEPDQRRAIAQAVEEALAQLLAERGLPPGWGEAAQIDRLEAGQFQVAAAARPATIGGQIAAALYAAASDSNAGGAT